MSLRLSPQSFAFTLLLGSLAALPPLSIDMSLPALPDLGTTLGASPSQAAWTISLFVAGFSLAQPVLGPLSDRIGRRPVLLFGLALYALGGLACTAAPTPGLLLLARLFQGIGAAAGPVMAFAVVRDAFEGQVARARLSYVSTVLTLAPVIAPTLGAQALAFTGWRGIYGLLCISGLMVLAAIFTFLPETRRVGPRHGVLASYRRVLSDPGCLGHALVNGLQFGGAFAWITGSPAVVMGLLGYSAPVFGLIFAAAAGSIMVGSTLNGFLARRGVSGSVKLMGGLLLTSSSSVAMLVLSQTMAPSLSWIMPLLVTFMFCRGFVGPNATHAAMESLPQLAGSTAALVGSMQMAIGAVSAAVVGASIAAYGVAGMAAQMAAFSLAALGVQLVTRRLAPQHA